MSETGRPHEEKQISAMLGELFGSQASLEPLTSSDRMGRRVRGLNLAEPLSEGQAELVVGLVDRYSIVSFPDQDTFGVDVVDLERLASHFGAVIPHPKNFSNYRNRDQTPVLAPVNERTSTLVDMAFPGEIKSARGADSAAVYVVTNLVGSGHDKEPEIVGGQHWHTDIEFEPIPLSTSMFLVDRAPTKRESGNGTWVTNPPREPGFYFPGAPPQLAEAREALPLNGETAYADTAAAYDSFNADEREMLDGILIRRRVRPEDDGWLIPLVHTNPRTGRKSLHSPVWASRGKNIAPAEVDGMSEEDSRDFLDRLEERCLRPEFRYDHAHRAGDITIWNNFSTLHTAPPSKRAVNDPEDARLMYRISCKGEPSYRLPRQDSDEWINENIKPPFRSAVAG